MAALSARATAFTPGNLHHLPRKGDRDEIERIKEQVPRPFSHAAGCVLSSQRLLGCPSVRGALETPANHTAREVGHGGPVRLGVGQIAGHQCWWQRQSRSSAFAGGAEHEACS
jgi:hypothetical protein